MFSIFSLWSAKILKIHSRSHTQRSTIKPFYVNQLLREVNPKRRSRRQLDQKKPYIIACFRQLPASFTVGSENRHSNCENKPLEPGQEYVFFLLVELNATSGVRQFSRIFVRVDLIMRFSSVNSGSLNADLSKPNTFMLLVVFNSVCSICIFGFYALC